MIKLSSMSSGRSSIVFVTTCTICCIVALSDRQVFNGGSSELPTALSANIIPTHTPARASGGGSTLNVDLHIGCQKLALIFFSAAFSSGEIRSADRMKNFRPLFPPRLGYQHSTTSH